MVVQYVNGNEIWASFNYSLYRRLDEATIFEKVLDIPVPFFVRMAGRIRPFSRAFRLGIRGIRILKSGTILLIAYGKIFRWENSLLVPVYSFDREFGPLREGWCEDNKGQCYLGEYFLNNSRKFPVKLLKSVDDGKSWHILLLFKDIRHIHCVQHDPFSESIWIGTGDRDEESSIYFSTDSGITWNLIGKNDQMYRTVSFLFTKDHVYWGSDSPTRQNFIYRYNRNNQGISKVVPVDGPVHYSTMLANDIKIFATTAEGNTEGPSAEWDNKAHIWVSQKGDNWVDLYSWEKDFFPNILGLGRIYFPHGQGKEKLYFSLEALKGVDNVFVQAALSSSIG